MDAECSLLLSLRTGIKLVYKKMKSILDAEGQYGCRIWVWLLWAEEYRYVLKGLRARPGLI